MREKAERGDVCIFFKQQSAVRQFLLYVGVCVRARRFVRREVVYVFIYSTSRVCCV